MRLESAQDLKQQLLRDIVKPLAARANGIRVAGAPAIAATERALGDHEAAVFGVSARRLNEVPGVHRSVALGVAPHKKGEYRLAIRVQRPALMHSPLVERLVQQARGEADVRMIGRIDKRTRRGAEAAAGGGAAGAVAAGIPWYRRDTRPVLIGASVAHVSVTAGTIGGFVARGGVVYVLSNNHVLADEDRARSGDWVLQRAPYDGGRQPKQRIARLRRWIRLRSTGINHVDAALARLEARIPYDTKRLRGLVSGADRSLAGVRTDPIDEGDLVYKIGRTTGATRGRVTAFDMDNVVVAYDRGNLRFDDQIEIEGTGRRSFSDGGDSGSLIVDADMRAVGLLFAGGDTGGSNGLGLTYANPIGRVLKELGATLLS